MITARPDQELRRQVYSCGLGGWGGILLKGEGVFIFISQERVRKVVVEGSGRKKVVYQCTIGLWTAG